MSRGIKILADRKVEDVSDEDWDLVVLPGGMPGAKNLKDSEALCKIVLSHMDLQKPLAAVCATPAVVLEPWGILQGKSATCYPAPQFLEVLGDKVTKGDVVVDGNVLTSRGPGTSLKFALKCVETLYGVEKANELAKQMLVTDYN